MVSISVPIYILFVNFNVIILHIFISHLVVMNSQYFNCPQIRLKQNICVAHSCQNILGKERINVIL